MWLSLLLSCLPTVPAAPGSGAWADSGVATASFDTAPDSGQTDSAQTDTGWPDSGTSGASTTDVPFVLLATVQADPDGLLVLTSNLPADLAGCLALAETGAPCLDEDGDELVDSWEELVIERLRPIIVLDEAEPFLDDSEGVLVDIARVVSAEDGRVRVFLMQGWSKDYGRCGLTAHSGDSERVALSLEIEGEDTRIVAAYTAAHEGTILDHGRVWQDDLDQLALSTDIDSGEPRWTVWASEGKHATYGSVDACEQASFLPCIEEDCDPDGVSDPSAYEVLPGVYNAGEPEAPLLGALDSVGFPGDDAWAEQDFCGGQDRSDTCSSAVVDKLTVDPF